MTWSYSGDPASSDKDSVRFLVGDTDTTDQLVQDEEINYVLTTEPNVFLASAVTADAIAAKFSRQADKRIGKLSISLSQRAKAYSALAGTLRVKSATSSEVFFGGQSIAGKLTLAEDDDAVQPRFSVGQDDYPGTGMGNDVIEGIHGD